MTLRGNVFENDWKPDQSGYLIVLTPSNQDGNAPFVSVQNVTLEYNTIKNGVGFIQTGRGNSNLTGPTTNLIVRNNLAYNLDDLEFGAGVSRTIQVANWPTPFLIDHNTMVTDQETERTAVTFADPQPVTRKLTGSISPTTSSNAGSTAFSPAARTAKATARSMRTSTRRSTSSSPATCSPVSI